MIDNLKWGGLLHDRGESEGRNEDLKPFKVYVQL